MCLSKQHEFESNCKSLFLVRHVGECSDWNRGLFPRAPLQEDSGYAGDLYSVLHPGSSHDHAGKPNISTYSRIEDLRNIQYNLFFKKIYL